MGKLEFLDALKRAMLGLPPDVQAKTLAYYEQRFVDGVVAGRSEEDVARELDDPKKIAMTLRASAHLSAFNETKSPVSLARLIVSGIGLAIFNLFMVVPAIVYSALLFALYVCALAFYLAGVATTASGLAGTNQLVLDWPSRFVNIDEDNKGGSLLVNIGHDGIHVQEVRPQAADADVKADADAKADGGPDVNVSVNVKVTGDDAPPERSRVRRGAAAIADGTVRISTGMDADSRTTQTLLGVGMVFGGIVLFLLSLVVTRYSWVGLKRYLQMNRSLLQGG